MRSQGHQTCCYQQMRPFQHPDKMSNVLWHVYDAGQLRRKGLLHMLAAATQKWLAQDPMLGAYCCHNAMTANAVAIVADCAASAPTGVRKQGAEEKVLYMLTAEAAD